MREYVEITLVSILIVVLHPCTAFLLPTPTTHRVPLRVAIVKHFRSPREHRLPDHDRRRSSQRRVGLALGKKRRKEIVVDDTWYDDSSLPDPLPGMSNPGDADFWEESREEEGISRPKKKTYARNEEDNLEDMLKGEFQSAMVKPEKGGSIQDEDFVPPKKSGKISLNYKEAVAARKGKSKRSVRLEGYGMPDSIFRNGPLSMHQDDGVGAEAGPGQEYEGGGDSAEFRRWRDTMKEVAPGGGSRTSQIYYFGDNGDEIQDEEEDRGDYSGYSG
ncbi:unnamed protein product, partial [Discosporangium mesarthrocarpum]